MVESATQKTVEEFCDKCERELDSQGHCPKHWPVEFARLAEFRRQGTINRVAKKTSVAEDLLTVLDSPISNTVDRLLDALAGLVASTSAARSATLESTRGKPQHAPLPQYVSAWAEQIQDQADDRLWELTEELGSFLNRPTDPKQWAACDHCGNRRLGESSYCGNCGERILEGARRCRLEGCPNRGRRRAGCPTDLTH